MYKSARDTIEVLTDSPRQAAATFLSRLQKQLSILLESAPETQSRKFECLKQSRPIR